MEPQSHLCFVQLMHPGGEHSPGRKGFKQWNTRRHRRKFLEVSGKCVRETETDTGPLHLWGEWEPESEVIERFGDPVQDGPRFLYRPFYSRPASYRGLQNTDPFVFGAFYYSGCKQGDGKRSNKLRHLARGSVILFGSQVSGKLVIDTVFVVDRWEDHFRQNFMSFTDKVSPLFMDVVLKPWHQSESGEAACRTESVTSLRLYWGATYDAPVDGMFSFFPACPAGERSNGFARPSIQISNVLNSENKMAVKISADVSPTEVQAWWKETRRQVEAQGLWCGISASEPPLRT